MNTEMTNQTKSLRITPSKNLLGPLSLGLTFYLSYLFTHFVILELYDLTDIRVILGSIFIGHLILNLLTLYKTGNRTFGDMIVRCKYIEITKQRSITRWLTLRTVLTSMIFYLIVYYINTTGFNELAFLGAIVIAVVLSWKFIRVNDYQLSLVDKLTNTYMVSTDH